MKIFSNNTLLVTRSVRRAMRRFYSKRQLHLVLRSEKLARLTDCFVLEYDDENPYLLNVCFYKIYPGSETLGGSFPTTKRPDNYFEDSSDIPFGRDRYDVDDYHLLSFYCRTLFAGGFYALVDDDGYDKIRECPSIPLEVLYLDENDMNSTPQIDMKKIVPLFSSYDCKRCKSSGQITLSDGIRIWCSDCCEKTKDVKKALLCAFGGIRKVCELLHQSTYPWDIYLFETLDLPDTKNLQVSLLPKKCAFLRGNKASFVLLKETFDSKQPKTVGSIKALVTLKVRTFDDVRYCLSIDYCDKTDETFSFALRSLKRAINRDKTAEYFQLAYFLMRELGYLPLIDQMESLVDLDKIKFQLITTHSFDQDDDSKYQVEPVHPIMGDLYSQPPNKKPKI